MELNPHARVTNIPCEPFKVVCIDDSAFKAEKRNFEQFFGNNPLPVKDKLYTVIGKQYIYRSDIKQQFMLYILAEFNYQLLGEPVSFFHIYFRPTETTFAEGILENAITEGKKLEEEMLIPVER